MKATPSSRHHALLAALMVSCLVTPGMSTAGDFSGEWHIMGTLVTDSGTDRYAPKAGFQKPDSWRIVAHGQNLSLTSPAGTISGKQTSPGTARFLGRYPIPVGQFTGYMQISIDASLTDNGKLLAGEEILYFMPNGLGVMQPMPLGREAWKIEGVR
jgi:hypothetical protein